LRSLRQKQWQMQISRRLSLPGSVSFSVCGSIFGFAV
jgi:hypothetical protein